MAMVGLLNVEERANPVPTAVDWAREYPEEQFVRIASAWRLLVIGAGAAVTWGAAGVAGFAVARLSGMI